MTDMKREVVARRALPVAVVVLVTAAVVALGLTWSGGRSSVVVLPGAPAAIGMRSAGEYSAQAGPVLRATNLQVDQNASFGSGSAMTWDYALNRLSIVQAGPDPGDGGGILTLQNTHGSGDSQIAFHDNNGSDVVNMGWANGGGNQPFYMLFLKGNTGLGLQGPPGGANPTHALSLYAGLADQAGIQWWNGSSLAQSDAGTGRIRYNTGTGVFEASTNGGAYAPFTGASIGNVTGTGTANSLTKWTGTSTVGNADATVTGTTFAIGANAGGNWTVNLGTSLTKIGPQVGDGNEGAELQVGNNTSTKDVIDVQSNVVDGYSAVGFYASTGATAAKGSVGYGNLSVGVTGFQGLDFLYSSGPDWVIGNSTATQFTFGGAGGTGSAALGMADGAAAIVAPAGTGRLRYNNGSAQWEASVNGGAYVPFATGTSGVFGGGTAQNVTMWTGANTAGNLSGSAIYAGDLVGSVGSAAEVRGATVASSTVPTLIPNAGSNTTGFGAQAAGNISLITSGTELMRFTAGTAIVEATNNTITGALGSAFELINSPASSTVPTLIPNRGSATSGIGADVAGDVSLIGFGAEYLRLSIADGRVQLLKSLETSSATGAAISVVATSATVPVLIPDRGDTTTGIGAAASGSGSLIASSTEVIRWYSGGATMIGDLFPSVGSGAEFRGATVASGTVPTLIPNAGSNTTGIGAQASGNLSTIIGGAETVRFTSGSEFLASVNLICQSASGCQLATSAASATVPTLIPNRSDTTTGVGAQAIGAVSLIAAGAEALRSSSTGTFLLSSILQASAASGFTLENLTASATVPTLIPNRNSTTTGIGAQASGNLSLIASATEVERVTSTGVLFQLSANKGTVTLAAGTGTATVLAGANCTCSDTTSLALCKPVVVSTTLTITGTGTDVIAYTCM